VNALPLIVPLDHLDQNHVIVMQKPLGRTQGGLIETLLINSGMHVIGQRQFLVDSRQISRHYQQFLEKPFFIPMVRYYTGQCLTVWLARGTAVQLRELRKLLGGPNVDSGSFRERLVGAGPSKLVLERYGVLDNGIHVSDSFAEGLREARVWFNIPPVTPIYDLEEKNMALREIHRHLWTTLARLSHPVQYSATNNWTANPEAPIDLDYRILVHGKAMPKCVSQIQSLLPHAVKDRQTIDDRTGEKYVKLEYRFRWGKADIAVVPLSHYSKRIGLGHLIDLLPTNQQREIQERKIQAYRRGRQAYRAEKDSIKRHYTKFFGLDE
jgi:nucleoside diphosphate kinase